MTTWTRLLAVAVFGGLDVLMSGEAARGAISTCSAPPAPSVVDGSVRPQEAVLRLNLPPGAAPEEIHWRALAETGPGVQEELWTHVSRGFSVLQDGAGSYVEFGAVGLRPATAHVFQVSIEATGCWSGTSSQVVTPGFSRAPPLPASLRQDVEDHFARPATLSKYDPVDFHLGRRGDGLGPDGVWQDFNPLGGPGNGARIHTDRETALLPVDVAVSIRPPAAHEHSYADIRFGLPATSTSATYNVDVQLRMHTVGANSRGYAAKLANGYYGATSPTLVIVRKLDRGIEPLERLVLPNVACGTPDPYDPCSCRPPDLRSARVWLRGEIRDVDSMLSGRAPRITASVAWETPEQPCTGGLETCPFFCQITTTDDSAEGAAMTAIAGDRGVQAHERDILVDVIRAGSGEDVVPLREVSGAGSGSPLVVTAASGSDVAWQWETVTGQGVAYAFYRGTLRSPGQWQYDHAVIDTTQCGLTSSSTVVPDRQDGVDSYYLVAMRQGSGDGSLGVDSQGVERPPAMPACP